jgi:GNAT superfamily N-acetyltransferase
MTESIVAWNHDLLAPAVEVFIEVFNAEPWNDRWTIDTATKRLSDLMSVPGFEGAALLVGGTLTAFAGGYRQRWWDGSDHFYLAEMAVRSENQRSGYGTRLLATFLDGLHGVTQDYLLTATDSPAAIFYHRAGFRPAHRQGLMTRPR